MPRYLPFRNFMKNTTAILRNFEAEYSNCAIYEMESY